MKNLIEQEMEKFWDNTVKFTTSLWRTNEMLVQDLMKGSEKMLKTQQEIQKLVFKIFFNK